MQVSNRGLWLYLTSTKREYYLSFEHFPWFRNATVQQLSSVAVERGHILHWAELDVDLDLERIEHPQHYPLVAKHEQKLLRVSDPRVAGRKKPAAHT